MSRRVRDLMHRDFIQVSPHERVADVLQLMALARVRALPVIHGGVWQGLVSHRDLALAALAGHGVPPGDIAEHVRAIAPVSPDATLSEAARRMLGDAAPCLLAVEGEAGEARVVGLLTESDLLREAYGTGGGPAA